MPKRKTLEEFKNEANLKHNNFYTYENVIYINSTEKVNITCPIHGNFNQQANSHLQGKGCSKCRTAKIASWRTVPLKDIITSAKNKHNNKYTYNNNINYNKQTDLLSIICPIHGIFKQTANDHLAGCGCQTCANEARNSKYQNEPTILYYIYFPFLNLYKIGITLKRSGISKRYSSETQTYIVLKETLYTDGRSAYIKEQQILRQFKDKKYKGPNIFKLGGHTECFIENILKI